MDLCPVLLPVFGIPWPVLEASLCDSPADFAPLLSLYSGDNCNKKASDNKCKLRWLAKPGVNYFIRVYGVGDQVGNFGLTMTEFNWVQIECRNQKGLREQDTDLDMSCTCSDLNSDDMSSYTVPSLV